jgi:parvulin-like peptidyl-prolyl isomerase
MPNLLLCLTGGILLSAATAWGQAVPSVLIDRIVAVVNEEVITLSEIQEELLKSRQSLSPAILTGIRTEPPNPSEKVMLTQQIERTLLLQQARKKGVTVESGEVDKTVEQTRTQSRLADPKEFEAALARQGFTLQEYRDEVRDQLLIMKLINREVRSEILLSDRDLLGYYNKQADRFSLPTEYRVGQILLRAASAEARAAQMEKARALRDRLLEGADFAELARQASDGSERDAGGDLGLIRENHLLPELAAALRAMKPKEISPPVISQAGIHLLRLEEVRPGRVQAFDEVRSQVEDLAYQEKVQERLEQWLKSLWAQSRVEIRF